MTTYYWVGGTGTWDDVTTTNWSLTSGGSGGAGVPSGTDDVIFNSASSAGGYTVTILSGVVVYANNITLNAPPTGTLTFNGNNNICSIYGNVTVAATGVTTTSWRIYCYGGVTQIFTTNNVPISAIEIVVIGTVVSLATALTLTAGFTLSNGTFTTNNYNVTSPIYSAGSNAKTFNFGTSVVTLAGSGTYLSLSGTNITFNSSTATFVFPNSASVTVNLGVVTCTLGTVRNSGAGAIVFSASATGAITVNTLENTVRPTAFTFPAGKTITVNNFNVSGTAGNLVTITSTTSGTAATLSKASGTVSSDYLSLKDSTATGGATWYAGANSTNVSGNTGWIFSAAPTSTGFLGLLL